MEQLEADENTSAEIIKNGPLPYALGIAMTRARAGELGIIELFTTAERLTAAGMRDLAIVLYQLWLKHTQSPMRFAVLFNLGVSLSESGNYPEAEQAYRQSVELHPGFAQSRINLGSNLWHQERKEEAIEQWRFVISSGILTPEIDRAQYVMVCNKLGRALDESRLLDEAEELYGRSLAADPTQEVILYHWIYLRQQQCKWPTLVEANGISVDFMLRTMAPFVLMALVDDPKMQLESSRHYVNQVVTTGLVPMSSSAGYEHARLRIGYMSYDFRVHPVARLAVELFEQHDRSRVEIYGFCSSQDDGSMLRNRVINAMDHYISLHGKDDEEAARLIRELEIDVLIDLSGHTAGSRPDVLAHRPAPVQVAYLGFPATTANPYADYVLVDRYVVPPEEAQYMSEKPLYMPTSLQVSDRKREIGPCPTRASCSLPEEAFVFCSFNNNYKYTPEIFSAWMQILHQVPNSVLWLVADNKWSLASFYRNAAQHGIPAERIIFAPRVSPPEYLARYQLADLFLDTFPFNAGTTANDALWMGLPIVTYSGRSFCARLAGSLLTAVGLPQLITHNLDDYIAKASEIGNNRPYAASLKQYLKDKRDSLPLFDIPRLAREVEDCLFEAVEETRQQANA
jgi:predicted O-linked N-acetylglucosamine transferase (SPINDLY family)